MSQTTPAAVESANEEVDEGRKVFEKLQLDMANDQRRLKRTALDLKALTSEISGTTFEYMQELLALMLQMRDFQMEMADEFEDRLSAIESDIQPPALDEEEATKLKEFILGSIAVIKRNLEMAPADDVRQALETLKGLGDECLKIVEEASTTLDEDEEQEEEEETDEPDGTN